LETFIASITRIDQGISQVNLGDVLVELRLYTKLVIEATET
jgi:hypothetical protein